VVEEADETLFWLELLLEANIIEKYLIESLLDESDQLVKIMNTIRHNKKTKT
jgi:four helix bundle protein